MPEPQPEETASCDGFDGHAARYAAVWDGDPAAEAQRSRVHEVLAEVLAPGSLVLDVGCGIGTDAAWLTRSGHQVVGIDASPGMVGQARRAAPGSAFHVLSAEDLAASVDQLGDQRFDAALLNFGVANVVPLSVVAAGLRRLLRPGGTVVVVFMPRVNPAWMLGALKRGQLSAARKRLRRSVAVVVEREAVPVRYLQPKEIVQAFRPWFAPGAVHGLGAVSPPPGSRRRGGTRLDRWLGTVSGALGVGDHVVMVLQRSQSPEPLSRLSRSLRRVRTARASRRGDPQLQTLILETTVGCQSACIGCSHRGRAGGEALTAARAGALAREAVALGAREALLTGGEPLLRPDLWALADAVQREGLALTLLTNGLALRQHAASVARWCDAVVVSLDGVDRDTYRATRGVDGWGAVVGGLAALRREAPRLPLTARVTLSEHNVGRLVEIVERAPLLGFDSVSLLAPDVWTPDTLGRSAPDDASQARTAVGPVAPRVLQRQLELLVSRGLRSRVSNSDDGLARVVALVGAAAGGAATVAPACDAPTTAALVTADLKLRPCFFLPADADASRGLGAALEQARPARAGLDIRSHPTCARCVCWARQA